MFRRALLRASVKEPRYVMYAATTITALGLGLMMPHSVSLVHAAPSTRILNGRVANAFASRENASISSPPNTLVHIPSISCDKCNKKITDHLNEHPAISQVLISTKFKLASMQLDLSKLSRDDLVSYIREVKHVVKPVHAANEQQVLNNQANMVREIAWSDTEHVTDIEVYRRHAQCDACRESLRPDSPCLSDSWKFQQCVENVDRKMQHMDIPADEEKANKLYDDMAITCVPTLITLKNCHVKHMEGSR